MKRLSTYISILALALVMDSCKKMTEGLDTSPNSPIDAPADLVLNGAQVASILVYEGTMARSAGIFAGSFTGVDRQYISLNNYISTAPDYDDAWDNLYSRVIYQAKIVETKSLAVNNKTMVGIAQVMQAQAFGLAADLWGDVPFSEVGDPVAYPQPKFDTQAEVYTGVQTLLDDAITNLTANVGVNPGAKDIFYGGDRNKWIAAAHTLKARFYLHTKDYDNAITQANLGITSAANNMMAAHGSTYASDFNVFYSFLTYDRPGYMNAEAATLPKLLDSSDPLYRGDAKTDETARFGFYYQTGLNTGDIDPNVLVDFDWGTPSSENGFFGATTPFPLVTFEENQLILAESHLKKAAPDETAALAALNTYRAYMNTGANISPGYLANGYQYLPYLAIDFLPLGMQNPDNLSSAQALLVEIIEEKYVALLGQIEQFNDVRRTKNLLGILPNTGTQLPQRFLYPQSELNSNVNTPVQAAGALFTATTINATAY